MQRGKKKKSKDRAAQEEAWRPSALMPNQTTADGEPVARKEGAEWYPRAARVVGMCVNVEDKEVTPPSTPNPNLDLDLDQALPLTLLLPYPYP